MLRVGTRLVVNELIFRGWKINLCHIVFEYLVNLFSDWLILSSCSRTQVNKVTHLECASLIDDRSKRGSAGPASTFKAFFIGHTV